ncbi:nucleolar MIF4G domain-containing protein 1 homolog [Malaya genurostris]|uniref:nucleolar MIF4G domain-containing protein 1 homolog n=1 Tax=Malaya genurostris TaxID=325434 RepID=UPI0026F391C9|nr:nucleolar MIF4G domain-containing protein 1 homolog [Malaya genurostris]
MKIRPQKHVRLGFSGKPKLVRKSNQPKTRKEIRKDKRQQKKINRFNYHSRKRKDRYEHVDEPMSKQKRDTDSEDEVDNADDEEIESDFEEDVYHESKSIVKNDVKQDIVMSQLEKERQNELRELKSYEHGLKEKRIAQLQAANDEDDMIIKKYEKLLKINRRKNKDGVPKSFNDGLDYALELCTEDNVRKMYEAAKEAESLEHNSEDDFADDVVEVLGIRKKCTKNIMDAQNDNKFPKEKVARRMENLKEIEKKYFGDEDLDSLDGFDSELEVDLNEESDYSENDELFDSDEEGCDLNSSNKKLKSPSKNVKRNAKQVNFTEEKPKQIELRKKTDPEQDSEIDEKVFGNSDCDDLESTSNKNSSAMKINCQLVKESDTWEDIYGRKRDRDGNVINVDSSNNKYVPPHLRARLGTNQPKDAKYQEKLLRLERQLKGQVNRLAESNVHRISIELENLYMQHSRFDMNSTLTNLIIGAIVSPSLSSEKMVLEHTLLITILHANVGSEVGSHFLEVVVERFNKIVQQIETLKVEDKTLDNFLLVLCHLYTFQIFKSKLIYDIVDRLLTTLNEKAVECILLMLRSIGFVLRKNDPLALKEMIQKVQKRVLETSEDMKNDARVKFMINILLAVKNNNMNKIPQYDPGLAEHFRKILKGMITNGKYVSTLNIGLDDLLKVDERGKWWLVGSAWNGSDDSHGKSNQNSFSTGVTFSQQLQELARKQRMNTDDKRNVFCVIMSAEDYLDAFDKILRLAIKDQRIVVTVIVHCCLSEKDYNPYYGVLSQKFSEYDRRYQLAMQYIIWDRLMDINSLKQASIKHLAKLLIHLISEGGLPLSVLKVIEFAEIDKTTLRLVRQIMLGILLMDDENKCLQVFNRIAPSYKLKAFKDSLRLFLHHFLLKGSDKSNVAREEMQLLQQRISMAGRMLDTSDMKIKF